MNGLIESRAISLGDPKEKPRTGKVEIRFGNPETEATRLAELYTPPETIEHLAGIKPDMTGEDVKRELFDSSNILLNAYKDGKIIGTITVQRPPFGLASVTLSRLAVDKDYRNQEVALNLLRAAVALGFNRESGIGVTQIRAAVILGVSGSEKAEKLLEKEKFERLGAIQDSCFGWSHSRRKLVLRDVQQYCINLSDYKHNRPNAHIKYFPKPLVENFP